MVTPIPFPQRVSAELRAEMARQKRSINELADALQISRKTAGLRYSGESDLTLDEIDAAALWLDVPRAQLLGVMREAVA